MSGTDTKMTRRTMMKGAGWTLSACALGATASTTGAAQSTPTPTPTPDDGSDSSDSWFDDIGAKSAAGGLVFSPASAVISWLSGDSGSNKADALRREATHDFKRYHNSVTRQLKAREGVLDYVFDGIFEDAKLAGIEKINKEAKQSEVETAALEVAKSEVATVQKNIREAGEQGLKTYKNYVDQYDEQGLSADVFGFYRSADETHMTVNTVEVNKEHEYQLVDGSTTTVTEYKFSAGGGNTYVSWLNTEETAAYGTGYDDEYRDDGDYIHLRTPMVESPDGKDIPVLPIKRDIQWMNVHSEYIEKTTLNHQFKGVEDRWQNQLKQDILTWVDNAYGAVAAGKIQPGELMSSSSLIQAISDDEPAKRAVASLRASNVGVEPEHPVTVSTGLPGLQEASVTAYDVVIGSTGTDAKLSEGQTVEPSGKNYDYVLNYTPGDIEVTWPYYETQIDGGTLTVTETPGVPVMNWLGSEMTMQVTTNQGETVTFSPHEFADPEAAESSFTVDLSDKLENAIAEVDSVLIYSAGGDANATKFLDQPFTVEAVGGDVSELDFSHDREIHKTDNYLTEEEWKQRKEDLKETLEDVESSSGGPFSGFSFPDLGPDLPTLPGLGFVESVIVGGAAVFTLDFLRK